VSARRSCGAPAPARLVAVLVACGGVSSSIPVRADDATCVASSEQALELRESGHLHAALEQLAVCADTACPPEVHEECSQRIERVTAAMPTLVLAATDAAGNDLPAVGVTMDGTPLGHPLDGRPLAIDPGPHTFRFDVPGQPTVERVFVLREGEKDRRERVVLGEVPAVPPPPAIPAPAATPPAAPPPPPSFWTRQRAVAVGLGSAGIVGLGIGAAFVGYAAMSQNREKIDCPPGPCVKYRQGVEDYDTAQKNATGATIAFVAGGAFAAGGIVLWLTAPPRRPSSSPTGLTLSPARIGGGTGLILQGSL
jgi:hypothetical protein